MSGLKVSMTEVAFTKNFKPCEHCGKEFNASLDGLFKARFCGATCLMDWSINSGEEEQGGA